MQTSDSFPCKPEMAFFLVIFIIQMTHLDEFYEWKQIQKFQKGVYYLNARRILTKLAAPFVEYKAIAKVFAVDNHQYIHHHRKKQANNILSSCSLLFLKTLYHFISQSIQYSILKVACVNWEMSYTRQLQSSILQRQEADILWKYVQCM